jgi:mannose-6-phosphate isomerase
VKRLQNVIQPYAWGSLTAIPDLLGVPPSGAPQAELWIGAHPAAPSTVDGTSLEAVVAAAPEATLGPTALARFGPRLPFLLKVLAAAKPLSLQAHPSLDQARAGYAREEAAKVPRGAAHRNYRDPNHKPELICALTEFRALCGFRERSATLSLLRGLGVPVLDPHVAALERAGLSSFFEAVMTAPNRAELATAVAEACERRPVRGFENECVNAVRLAAEYPHDVGVIGALLLNLVTLRPGQALALGAGNLHAYLEGTGVEVMANSDNVLRGGLTPKHVDVPELLSVLDFIDGPARLLAPSSGAEAIYSTPFEDFRLSRVTVDAPLTLNRLGPDVLLTLEGAAVVNGVALTKGQSAFVGFAEGPLRLSGQGVVYRATVNLSAP